jgi:hypothetical protein
MLSFPISSKPLEPIAGRNRQIEESLYPIDLVQLPPRDRPQGSRTGPSRRCRTGAIEDVLCPTVPE